MLSPLHVYNSCHVSHVSCVGEEQVHATCDVLIYVLYAVQFGWCMFWVYGLHVNYCSHCNVITYRVILYLCI